MNEFEYNLIEIMQYEELMKKNEHRFRETWDTT